MFQGAQQGSADPLIGSEGNPLVDSDDEDLSNVLQDAEIRQSHGLVKLIRFIVIGSLIGGLGLALIAVVIGAPGLLGYAGGIGAALGAIIGFVFGAPPWVHDVLSIFRLFP